MNLSGRIQHLTEQANYRQFDYGRLYRSQILATLYGEHEVAYDSKTSDFNS